MKNIHVLPTDKPSRLSINTCFDNILELWDEIDVPKIKNDGCIQYHNIYITSDEKIKEGDWHLYENEAKKTTKETLAYIESSGDEEFKKIILTTDQDLIKDGVQAIDDEFLEWFVKNSSCEEVKTIYGLFNPMGRQVDPKNLVQNQSKCVWKYKIIIPKEEPIQEPCCTPIGQIKRYVDCKGCDRKPVPMTLEEAAEAYVNKEGDIPTTELEDAIFKQGFIDGAKWQVKSMYSEEDIISLIQFLSQDEDFDSYTSVSKETAKYYLERFKVERL